VFREERISGLREIAPGINQRTVEIEHEKAGQSS
jgi:hypothetical protein